MRTADTSNTAAKCRAAVGEQPPLDLGIDPPVGQCAWCHEPIRQVHGVIVERRYGYGICVLSLHRTCQLAAGAEGIMRLVRERETDWARLLGANDGVGNR